MNKHTATVLPIAFIISFLLIFSPGCGGGGGGGGSSTPASVQSGVFFDSAVDGLAYETATQSGYTAYGTFKYLPGETIAFYIGDLFIGEGKAKPKMSPVDLVEGAMDESHPAVTNICRLLQSIDYDGDPDNGILITEEIAAKVDTFQLDFHDSINNFANSNNITTLFASLNNLELYDQGVTGYLVPSAQAQAHMWASLNGMPDGIVKTATGAYTYNSNSHLLTINYSDSTFTGCGPSLTRPDEFTILSVNSVQMIFDEDDGPMVWNRDSGTGSDFIGSWTFFDTDTGNTYTVEIEADGSVVVVGYIVYCDEEVTGGGTFDVPHKTIAIDGNYSDWQTSDRVYRDTDGPECNNEPGLDLQEVYLAQDETYLYVRFVLNGPLRDTFAYLFGENHRHMWVVNRNNGTNITYSSAYDAPVALPDSFVHIDGNQFEAKFYKADVEEYWVGEQINAWLDQGFSTICRDLVNLPELLIDW